MALNGGSEAAASHLLVVFRDHTPEGHPGVADGLERLIRDGTLRAASMQPINPFDPPEVQTANWQRMERTVKEQGVELVVLYHFHYVGVGDLPARIERLRSLPHRPLVALTNGDPFLNGLFREPFPKMFLQAAEAVDVVLTTSMGASGDQIASRTKAPIALLPNSTCQIRFGSPSAPPSERPEFRVIFIGSNNRRRNLLRSTYRYSRRRERLVHKLSDRFGAGFAVFGEGWHGVEGWQGPISFDKQRDACRRAAVIVGGVPYSFATYYTSNRPFNQITSAVPFIDLRVEGVDRILRDGEHWHLASSDDELLDVCDDLLARPAPARTELGLAAADHVLSHHTTEQRLRSLVTTLSGLRSAILDERPAPPPDMRFFLPEVDRATEMPLATRRWDNQPDKASAW